MDNTTEAETDFSEVDFRSMISAVLNHEYRFCRFDRADQRGSHCIYLRHDVDISPVMAMRLGVIEHEIGICANFFFQLNAETYSGLARSTIAIIEELRVLGHCVGLHVDENLVTPEEGPVRRTLDWFNDCVTPIDPAISFHRPTRSVLKKDFAAFANAYGSTFFDPDRYFSDSRRNGVFRGQVLSAVKSGATPVQLLLHPAWWYPESDMKAFADRILARRRTETAEYLLENFAAVFGPVLGSAEEPKSHGL